jgi:hypothetical protein
MSETVDLTALRAAFPAEHVGKLPRVTCSDCTNNKGSCGKHQKASCAECGNWISVKHIHLDYVGHADVTMRLLDVDPEWTWQPKATRPDPEVMKAAIASGNPEIVKAVIDNAPPKFEHDRNGNMVGLWINLTVGGVTRPGVGSCPGNQNDAEKVLIGDALRNAAMRFGVATDLWAKGDRADPTAENATASAGKAERNGRPASGGSAFDDAAPSAQAQVWRPREPKPAVDQKPDLGDWGIRVDGIMTAEDAAELDAELRQVFEAKRIDAGKANQIRAAIKARVAKLNARQGAAA